jgi:hypothetical protein
MQILKKVQLHNLRGCFQVTGGNGARSDTLWGEIDFAPCYTEKLLVVA